MKFILFITLFVCNILYSQCPDNLNGNNNNPTFIIVYVYNSSFQIIDTIQCNTNPSGQVNCTNISGGVYYSIINTNCFYDANQNNIPDPALPIELLNFNARFNNTYNEINWTTATENNNDYFIIEHSINGIDWKIINKTTGAGNSTQLIDYQYNDYKYLDTINYYRLKQVDYNGDFKLYDPVAVDNTVKDKDVIRIINTLGQDVNTDAPGVVILIYSDGTIKRTWNQ